MQRDLAPPLRAQHLDDLLAQPLRHVGVLADVEDRGARGLGRRVHGGRGQRELAGDVVGVAALGHLVHPADGVGDLGGLLALGVRRVDDGLAPGDLGVDQAAGVAHVRAEAAGLREQQVGDGAEEGGGGAHEGGEHEGVERVGLGDLEPAAVAAELAAEEDARGEPRDHLEHVVADVLRRPLRAVAEDVVQGGDGLVDEVLRHEAERLRQLDPDRVLDHPVVLEPEAEGLETGVVDHEILGV